MKHFRLLLATLLAVVCSTGAWAQAFTSGGHQYVPIYGYTTTDEACLLRLAAGSVDVTIPGTVYNNGQAYRVTNISSHWLDDCKTTLQSVTLPSTLEDYERLAGGHFIVNFKGCTSLKKVDLRECANFPWLGYEVFKGLTSLQTVQLPSSILHIEKRAFEGCENLGYVNLDNITDFEYRALADCKALESITLSNVLIEDEVFSGCTGLRFLSLDHCRLGKGVFEGCSSLVTVSLYNWDYPIQERTFKNCTSLRVFSVPATVTSIGPEAFAGCTSLEIVSLPEPESSIGEKAFYGCTSLNNITLPETVNYIGKSAFTDVKTFDSPGSRVICVHPDFYQTPSNVTVNVPCGMTGKYKTLVGWQKSGFIFKESGNMTLNAYAGECSTGVTIQADEGAVWTIAAAGGSLTRTLALPQQITVTAPEDEIEKVIYNGEDITSQGTNDGSNKIFTLSSFTDVNNLYVFTNPLPEVAGEEDWCWNGNMEGGQITQWVNTWAPETEQKTWTRIILEGNSAWVPSGVNNEDWKLIRKWLGGSETAGTHTSGYHAHYLDMKNAIFLPVNWDFYGDLLVGEEGDVPDFAFAECVNLDTLILPTRAYYLGERIFYGTRSNLVVHAPWEEPVTDMSGECFGENDADVSGMTLIVPRGSLEAYQNAEHWRAFGTIIEEPMTADEEQVTILCSDRSAAVQAWMNGNTNMGTVDTETGMLTFIMKKTGDLQLRVPTTHHVSKIYINGVDETENCTVAQGSGYTSYTHAALTQTSNTVFIQFEGTATGDVNGDGQVTIADVTKLVNIILGKE